MFDTECTGLFIITQVVGFGGWLGLLSRVADPELRNAVTDPLKCTMFLKIFDPPLLAYFCMCALQFLFSYKMKNVPLIFEI